MVQQIRNEQTYVQGRAQKSLIFYYTNNIKCYNHETLTRMFITPIPYEFYLNSYDIFLSVGSLLRVLIFVDINP